MLDKILPSVGRTAFVAIRESLGPVHVWLTKDEITSELPNQLAKLESRGYNLYFSPFSFEGDLQTYSGRTQANSRVARCLFLDIDVKDQTTPTLDFAVQELIRFIHHSAMPLPSYVVDTGGGLHVYWAFDDDVTTAVWRPIAHALQAMCNHFSLRVDAHCTRDPARILRLPGYINHKHAGAPVAQVIAGTGATVDPGAIASALRPFLGTSMISSSNPTLSLGFQVPNYTAVKSTFNIVDRPPASWQRIKDISNDGRGCDAVRALISDHSVGTYDSWTWALRLANATDDVEQALTDTCATNPYFNMGDSLRKARTFSGVPMCHEMASIAPSVCANCPNNGKFKSPVQVESVPDLTPIVQMESVPDQQVVLPPGYINSPWGLALEHEEYPGVADMESVFCPGTSAHVIGIVRLPGAINQQMETSIKVRFKTPHITVDFVAGSSQLSKMAQSELISQAMNARIPTKEIKNKRANIMTFLNECMQISLHDRPIEEDGVSAAQFGPTNRASPDDFILGHYVYRAKQGPARVDIAPEIQTYADQTLDPPTSMEDMNVRIEKVREWSRLLHQAYANTDALAQHHLLLASGFATVLSPFLLNEADRGGVLVANSTVSGSGKTTLMRVVSGIYSSGSWSVATNTTRMAFESRFLIPANALPVCMDELARGSFDRNANEFRELALMSTNQQGRNRLVNPTSGRWSTFFYITTNSDPHKLVMNSGGGADGAAARMINIEVPPHQNRDYTTINNLERWIIENKGLIGTMWVQYVLDNMQAIRTEFMKVRSELACKLPDSEVASSRFSIATLALTITAARFATKINLLHSNLPLIESAAHALLRTNLESIKNERVTEAEVFQNLVNSSFDKVVMYRQMVTGGFALIGASGVVPREIVGRLEYMLDGSVVFKVTTKHIKDFCNQHNASYRDVRRWLITTTGSEDTTVRLFSYSDGAQFVRGRGFVVSIDAESFDTSALLATRMERESQESAGGGGS